MRGSVGYEFQFGIGDGFPPDAPCSAETRDVHGHCFAYLAGEVFFAVGEGSRKREGGLGIKSGRGGVVLLADPDLALDEIAAAFREGVGDILGFLPDGPAVAVVPVVADVRLFPAVDDHDRAVSDGEALSLDFLKIDFRIPGGDVKGIGHGLDHCLVILQGLQHEAVVAGRPDKRASPQEAAQDAARVLAVNEPAVIVIVLAP